MEIMSSVGEPECQRMLMVTIVCSTVCVEVTWSVFSIKVMIVMMVRMTMT